MMKFRMEKGNIFLTTGKYMKEALKKINSKEMENIFMKMENIIQANEKKI